MRSLDAKIFWSFLIPLNANDENIREPIKNGNPPVMHNSTPLEGAFGPNNNNAPVTAAQTINSITSLTVLTCFRRSRYIKIEINAIMIVNILTII